MRKYLSGTGFISVALSGIALLKGMKDQPFTWRTVLAWLSWALTLAFSFGVLSDNRAAVRGMPPVEAKPSKQEKKLLKHLH